MSQNASSANDANLPPVPELPAQPEPGRLAQALAGTGFGGTGWRPPPQSALDPFSMPPIPPVPNFTGAVVATAAASGTSSGSDGSVAASPFGP